jgi:hypothetical protein
MLPMLQRKLGFLIMLISIIIGASSTVLAQGQIPNGSKCSDNNPPAGQMGQIHASCSSQRCYPGPRGASGDPGPWYCVAGAKRCAWPGSDGGEWDEVRELSGTKYKCADPGTGSASFFGMEGK